MSKHTVPFESLFAPQSIAVVGASTREGTVGRDIMANLVSAFKGTIVGVNPKASDILGKPCYPTVDAIPHAVDLVVIVVPAAAVPAVLTAAGEKGAKAAIVISAGFKEAGNAQLESELIAIANRYNIALVGPNCLGVIAPSAHMNASFAVGMPKAGNVAFLSQSGALCTAVLDYAEAHNIGFSAFVSMGNKAVVDEAAMLEYLANDPHTDVVAMYVESLADGVAFMKAAQKLTRAATPKPVIVLKSGRTSAGASAASSHTGALAGDDVMYDAIFAQSGVVRAARVAEFFDFITVASRNPIPRGSRTAIITNAGGVGVLTTDEVVSSGLELAQLDQETARDLAAQLPPAASVKNPIDVLGDARADRYGIAIDMVTKNENVDNVIVLLTPQSMTESVKTAEHIITAKEKYHKPIIASFIGAASVAEGVALLEAHGIATTAFPMQAAKALGLFAQYRQDGAQHTEAEAPSSHGKETKEITRAKHIVAQAYTDGRMSLSEPEAYEVLSAFGLPLLPWRLVKTADEAASAVAEIGGECVFKIVSPDIIHKSDVGGVRLLVTEHTAAHEYEQLMANVTKHVPHAQINGVLVVAMAQGERTEVVIGGKNDALGSFVMVGLGGIFVEVFKDVAFGIVPIAPSYVRKMVESLKGFPLLNGARGQKPRDVDAFVETVGCVQNVLRECPQISECDLNPVVVFQKGNGACTLDGRILLKPNNNE